MATSGSSNWTATRAQIIQAAARKLIVLKQGYSLSAEITQNFDFALNAMVKNWSATGIHVWTVEEGILFPQLDQTRYAMAASATDHSADAYSYWNTTISAAEASGQTTLSVTSSASMAVSDKIGVVVDDGTLHWSTVSSKPDSTSVVIANALDDDAAAGNYVFGYTSNIVRPLHIVDARRYEIATGIETPLTPMSHLGYQHLPNKTQEGTVNSFYYQPALGTGYLYLWLEPDKIITNLIRFTWHRPIEDFDAAGDNPDLPQEWISPLVWNLALEMLPEYGARAGIDAQTIVAKAGSTLSAVTGNDKEDTSWYVTPDVDPIRW